MNQILSQAEEAPQLEYVKFKGAEQPRKTFFYERVSGRAEPGFISMPDDAKEIVAVTENEAAGMKPSTWTQIGVSDGKKYVETIMNCGVKRGQSVPVEKAREIMKAAFEAELAVARGHFERPVLQTYHFMGASQGTQGYEELARRRT